jgi:hypothetical protein
MKVPVFLADNLSSLLAEALLRRRGPKAALYPSALRAEAALPHSLIVLTTLSVAPLQGWQVILLERRLVVLRQRREVPFGTMCRAFRT